MLNVLFVVDDLAAVRSTVDPGALASELAELGNDVVFAIPGKESKTADAKEQRYAVRTFSEIDGHRAKLFANGQSPDVIHAWTTNEHACLLCENLLQNGVSKLVVHIDMADQVPLETGSTRQVSLFNAAAALTTAAGASEAATRFHQPRLMLWPTSDVVAISRREENDQVRRRLGIPVNSTVLCYIGDVDAATARAAHSVYLAVAMLNREGMPATLLRVGRDHHPFLGMDEQWARKHSVELGGRVFAEVAPLLAVADLFIQTGPEARSGDGGIAAKLPQLFAFGRPVILPRTNIGRFVEHGVHAWFLPKLDGLAIIEAVRHLRSNPAPVSKLSEGALQFARQHFDRAAAARRLEDFYQAALGEIRSPNGASGFSYASSPTRQPAYSSIGSK